ncbi:MAG: DUF1194 domain-containing protein [Rhodoplanes sp.]
MAMTAAVLVSHSTISTWATEVDLLLALAADVSRSVDQQKFNLQRKGYAAAITNPRVIQAIRSGRFGRIAVCYIEWSGSISQNLLIDWTVINDAASARRFASQLAEAPRSFVDLTSISAGIDFAVAQIERAPFEAKRRVIDISGDGDDNNIGREVTDARDDAIAKGVTVNGIVVLDETLLSEDGSPYSTTELEHYFRDNVIGGPGAFVMVAQDFSAFGNVILNKLMAEIAGLPSTNTLANHITKDVQAVGLPKLADLPSRNDSGLLRERR